MMSFILLLLEWKDFTRNQIISFQISAGVFGTLGAFLGGVLGDYFAFSPRGRIHVALTSVIGGTIFYGLFLFSKSYQYAVFWYSMFHLWGGWTPAATLRPICAKLAENASERAQIVAAWILLEKTSSAIFGAPLVGFLTKRLFDSTDNASDEKQHWQIMKKRMHLHSICLFFPLYFGSYAPTFLFSWQERKQLMVT